MLPRLVSDMVRLIHRYALLYIFLGTFHRIFIYTLSSVYLNSSGEVVYVGHLYCRQ